MTRTREDGLEVVGAYKQDFVRMLVNCARWVHPETFKYLPVWYPTHFRTAPLYDAGWSTRQLNKGKPKLEANVFAAKALSYALGLGSQAGENWTCCHLWGVDDPKFAKVNTVIKDPRYFSCVGNMMRLPTPLKAITDSMPDIKLMLR